MPVGMALPTYSLLPTVSKRLKISKHWILSFPVFLLFGFYIAAPIERGINMDELLQNVATRQTGMNTSPVRDLLEQKTARLRSVRQKRTNSTFKHAVGESQAPTKCNCVQCEEDELCGGLWSGSKYPSLNTTVRSAITEKRIHIVVSHCKRDLDWISNFTDGYDIASMHVITKCGYPVKGVPDLATIEELPNVGRCDHSYAYYINNHLDQKVAKSEEENSVVVFLKDDMDRRTVHQGGQYGHKHPYNDLETMIQLASSQNGFSCGLRVSESIRFPNDTNKYSISAYHKTNTLFKFNLTDYEDNRKGFNYTSDQVKFVSDYPNLGSFYHTLVTNRSSTPDIVQVCYGGIFAASASALKSNDASIWKSAERRLSRGNNIQEGHYMERLWGLLLSKPLESFQVAALRNHSDALNELDKKAMLGALLKKIKETEVEKPKVEDDPKLKKWEKMWTFGFLW